MRPEPVMASSSRGRVVAVGIIVAIALYGPKFGALDTSLVAGLLAFGFIGLSYRRVLVHRTVSRFVAIILIVSIVAVGNTAVNMDAEWLVVGRYSRILLSSILLGMFSFNLGRRSVISARQLVVVTIGVLLVNSIVVLFEILYPSIARILAPIYQFDKSVREIRAFGLTAGFDTAGFFSVLGLALAFIEMRRRSQVGRQWMFPGTAAVVFAGSLLFTSRSAMALGGAVILCGMVMFVRSSRLSLSVTAIAVASASTIVALVYVLPLFQSTISFGERQTGRATEEIIVQNFKVSSVATWYQETARIPVAGVRSLVGDGLNPGYTDVGYITLLGTIGVLGLSLLLYAYFRTGYALIKLGHGMRLGRRPVASDSLRVFSLAYLGLIVVMNVKGLYLGTRGFHELFVLSAFGAIGYATGEAASESGERGNRSVVGGVGAPRSSRVMGP